MTETICILHAGTEKTGSTSLQRFLAMNATTLAKQLIWVPLALVRDPIRGPYSHLYLSTASRLSISTPDDLQTQLDLSSMEMVLEHRKNVVEALTAERNALSFTPSIVLVSCEHIHSRLRTDLDLAHAKALLEPFCSGFRIVVYLRRQYELAQSTAVTALRQGALEFRPIPNFNTGNGFDVVLGVDHDYFNYHQLLQRFERVFGATAVDVRLYETNELYANDVVEDFFNRLNCPIADMKRPGRENTSLRTEAILFLLKLNQYLRTNPRADAIRERVLAFMALVYGGTAQSAPSTAIFQFMSAFATSNEAVRRRWFPERKVLFPNTIVATDQHGAALSLSEADVFNIFVELFDSATNSA